MEKKQILKRYFSLFLALIMIIGIIPTNIFAETYKAPGKDEIFTTDWSLTEENQLKKNFWPLANFQYLIEVSPTSEPIKNPMVSYAGYFVRPDGRTVLRLVLRKFDKAASALWHIIQIKLEDNLNDLVEWGNPGTGIYMGASNYSGTGWYNDDLIYKEIRQFGSNNVEMAGANNVWDVNIRDSKNLAALPAAACNEFPINLVLNKGKTINDIKNEPLVQVRMLAEDKKRVACYTDEGTGKGNYSSYTFSNILPIKHDYEKDLLREIRDSSTTDRVFRAAGSTVEYNREKGYIDVRHRYNKVPITVNTVYGRDLGYRQTVDKRFFDILKPKKINGQDVIAHVFSTSNNGLPTSGRLDKSGDPISYTANGDPITPLNPAVKGSVPITKNEIHYITGSDLGYIQISNNSFDTGTQDASNIKTTKTFFQPLDSWMDGIGSLLNNSQGTTVRYYVDKDKVDKLFKEDDGLQYFPFYSAVIMDNKEGQYKYEFTLKNDQTLRGGDKINIDFANRFGKGDNNAGGQAGLRTREMRLSIKGEKADMFLGSNFACEGPYSILNKENGKHYSYTMQNGMDMALKAGTKITLYTNYNTGGELSLSFPGAKNILKANPVIDKTPIVFDWQATFSAGTVATTFHKPDIDEIFLGDKKITGRTAYEEAEINIKKYKEEDENSYQTIIAKPGNLKNTDDTRIDVVVNGKKVKGYEFDTDVPGLEKDGKTQRTFTMPELKRDMPILFTNKNVHVLAEDSRPPVVEQVQAKVNFDLNGVKSKENKDVIEKIAPLSKEYTTLIEDKMSAPDNDGHRTVLVNGGSENKAYKPSGFNDDNVKRDETNKTVTVKENIDGKEVERTFQNLINHEGKVYDIKNKDSEIAKKELAALKLRQMPDKYDIDMPQGKRLLGWTTVKLGDKKDANGDVITTADQFYKLQEEGKVLKNVTDWEKVDNKTNPETFIFDEKSPIDKNRTVYAVYGDGINIILHSNNTTDPKKEVIYKIPVTVDDLDRTDSILDATTAPTYKAKKGKLVIKAIPKVPYTSETDDIDKITDAKLKKFTKKGTAQDPNKEYTFIGWTLGSYDENGALTRPNTNNLIAGAANERIGELETGLVSNGTKRIPLKTEWIDGLRNNTRLYYVPNGFNLAIAPEDVLDGNDIDNTKTPITKAFEEGKDVHLFANYRPYFDITVKASYKDIDLTGYDAAQNKFGEYKALANAKKKKAANIGLLTRTAVTPYGKPTVHQNANYYPFKGGLKAWDGTDKDLKWTLPGFDELGQRKSYVSVVVPNDLVSKYNDFAVPNWGTLGLKTFLRLNNADGSVTVDHKAPKNLHHDAGNPYGDPVAKSQAFNIGPDAYTSATSRNAETVRRTNGREVIGYTIWNTSTPIDIPKPSIDNVFDTDKTIKLKWGDAEKHANIVKIKLTVAGGSEIVLKKQGDGTYKGGGLTAKVGEGKYADRLVIGEFKDGNTLLGKDGKKIIAKYTVKKATLEKDGEEGEIDINKRGTAAPVYGINQVDNEIQGAVVKPVIKFDIPNPLLNKPAVGTKIEKYDWAERFWTDDEWTKVESQFTAKKKDSKNKEYTEDWNGSEYIAQKWDKDNNKWVNIADTSKYTMKDNDKLGDTKTLVLEPKSDAYPNGVEDGDIVRIVSRQAGLHTSASTQDMDKLGGITGNYTDAYDATKLIDLNRRYVKIDLKAPAPTVETKDEKFRRYIDVTGSLDEVTKGRKVTLEVKYTDGTTEKFTPEVSVVNNEIKLKDFLSTIVRKGDKASITIVAEDEFGNKKEYNVDYTPTLVCNAFVKDFYVRSRRLSVTSDMDGVTVKVTVYKGLTEVAKGEVTVTRNGDYVSLELKQIANSSKSYRLKKGDIIRVNSEKQATEGTYTSNPFDIFVE